MMKRVFPDVQNLQIIQAVVISVASLVVFHCLRCPKTARTHINPLFVKIAAKRLLWNAIFPH
jgi:ABC-type glucose/galactose transport system permease subunit